MAHRLFLACLLVALGATAGCDTSSFDIPADAVSATTEYDMQQVKADLALPEAQVSEARIGYTDSVRPTYAFATHDDFERAADAVLRRSVSSGEALSLPLALRPLGDLAHFAPTPEQSLADHLGRVVIADSVYRLVRLESGGPGSIISTRDGIRVEEIASDLTALATNGKMNLNGHDMRDCVNLGLRTVSGISYYVRGVYAHDAFRSWTGRFRMYAESEIQISQDRPVSNDCDARDNDPLFFPATAGQIPQAFVSARVVGRDNNVCVAQTVSRNAPESGAGTEMFVRSERSRGVGQPVSYSQHQFGLDGPFGGSFQTLSTPGTTCTI